MLVRELKRENVTRGRVFRSIICRAGVTPKPAFAAADGRADRGQRRLGVLLGQIHGDLPRLRDLARPLRRVEPFGIEGQVAAYHLDDVFDRNLLLIELHVGFENLFGQRRGDLPSEERRVGHQRRQRAFDFPHIGIDILRQELDYLLRHLGPQLPGLALYDLDLRLEIRQQQLRRKPPLEASDQPLLDVFQFDGRLVGGHYELLVRQVQMIEYVEKGVDNQHVEHLIEMDEIVQLALDRRILKLRLKLVHRHVQHLQLRLTLLDLHADSLRDMRFPEARIAVYI